MWPSFEMRRSDSRCMRSAMAPERTSMCSGVGSMRARSGTAAPWLGRDRRDRRSRSTRRRRSSGPRWEVPRRRAAGTRPRSTAARPASRSAPARRPGPGRSSGGTSDTPMYSPSASWGSSFEMLFTRPVPSHSTFISSSPSVFTESTARSSASDDGSSSSSRSTDAGWSVSPLAMRAPPRRTSRAHQSE